jgi:hypothetical protein
MSAGGAIGGGAGGSGATSWLGVTSRLPTHGWANASHDDSTGGRGVRSRLGRGGDSDGGASTGVGSAGAGSGSGAGSCSGAGAGVLITGASKTPARYVRAVARSGGISPSGAINVPTEARPMTGAGGAGSGSARIGSGSAARIGSGAGAGAGIGSGSGSGTAARPSETTAAGSG